MWMHSNSSIECRQRLDDGIALAAVAASACLRRSRIATGWKTAAKSCCIRSPGAMKNRGIQAPRWRFWRNVHIAGPASAESGCTNAPAPGRWRGTFALRRCRSLKNEAERQQLHRVLPRLNRKLGIDKATSFAAVPRAEFRTAGDGAHGGLRSGAARTRPFGAGRRRQRGSLCRERAGQRAVWAAVLEGNFRAHIRCVLSRFSIRARRSLERPILSTSAPRICRVLCGVGIRSI